MVNSCNVFVIMQAIDKNCNYAHCLHPQRFTLKRTSHLLLTVQTDQNLLDQKQIFRKFFTNTEVQAGDLTAK